MKNIQHSIRLPLALDKALRQVAATRQISPYSLLQQAAREGVAALSGIAQPPLNTAHELAAIAVRLAHVERLVERALFTACAGYVYARAGGAANKDETKLAAEINAAFTRQLTQAGDI